MPRFYCPLPLDAGRFLDLPEDVARHAVGALRLRDGEALTLFNGDGGEYDGVLQIKGRRAAVQLGERHAVCRESPLAITLVQGISSGERMDLTIQKAVELGIAAIQPLVMRRTVARLAGEKLERRRAHWQAVAVAACEQCGRNLVPPIEPILEFSAWQARPSSTTATELCLLLDPAAGRSLADLDAPAGPVILMAGPEGGFDPAERIAAGRIGFTAVRLGSRILRTETAALAALAALQTLWGDLLK